MALCNLPKRHTRARLLLAPVAFCAATAYAVTQAPSDQCIVGDHAIGCLNERSIIELTTPRKDASTLEQLVQDKLASGECRLLDYGERVQVTSANGSERTQVRRFRDTSSYWIPATWARPATECEGTQTASALHQKLGVPDEPVSHELDEDARVASLPEQRGSPPRRWSDDRYGDNEARYADSGGFRPPPWPPRPLPSSRYAHPCEFKPVMTEEDLLACRDLRR